MAGKALSGPLSAADIEPLLQRAREGGAEVIRLLKTGSAYYARPRRPGWPARSPRMPVRCCRCVPGWTASTASPVYLGVEAEIGSAGVRRVVPRELTESELASLREAAEAVRAKQSDVASL